MAKQRKLKWGYAALNKNLLNYPLARDARVRPRWRKSNKTGRWLCDLPGDERIQFRLPADSKRRRCPTGFDMNVLFVLLREARVSQKNVVTFTSQATLLRALDVSISAYNRRRLHDALELWSAISIRHRCWFQTRKSSWVKGRERVVRYQDRLCKVLPPPLRIDTDKPERIHIDKEWRDIAADYFARVPLPLPLNAAAQNLILLVLTSASHPMSNDECDHKWGRPIRALCRKIGLEHGARRRVLDHAVAVTEAWFAKRGIEFFEVHTGDMITFGLGKIKAKAKCQKKEAPVMSEADDEEFVTEVDHDDDVVSQV